MCWCNPNIKTPQCRSIHCKPPVPELNPPSGGSSVQCSHNYNHLDTIYSTDKGVGNASYQRIDRFYCTKCLHQKEIFKSEDSSYKPDWYKG